MSFFYHKEFRGLFFQRHSCFTETGFNGDDLQTLPLEIFEKQFFHGKIIKDSKLIMEDGEGIDVKGIPRFFRDVMHQLGMPGDLK